MNVTGSTAFIGEIQALKAVLAEKDAEIERLKDRIVLLRAVIEEQQSLLARAADTLEEEFGEPILEGRDLSNKSPWNLIIELRKAAE